MSIHLLEKIQQNLGYPALKKIDPNIQDVALDPTMPSQASFAQAAIPAVLAALYKFLKTNEAANLLLQEDHTNSWMEIIFEDKKAELIKRIASYSTYTQEKAERKVDEIANEAVRLIKENIQLPDQKASIQNIISDDRNNILPYLPAVLNIGELLGDTTIDDKTNKMEGPISSLMHKIEKGFSKP